MQAEKIVVQHNLGVPANTDYPVYWPLHCGLCWSKQTGLLLISYAQPHKL